MVVNAIMIAFSKLECKSVWIACTHDPSMPTIVLINAHLQESIGTLSSQMWQFDAGGAKAQAVEMGHHHLK